MIFFRCAATVGLVVLVFMVMTASAFARSTTADIERARSLVAEGRALQAQNDLEGALRALQAADELARSATTALELAQLQATMGRIVEARATLRHVLEPTGPAEDPLVTANAQATAQDLDKELKTRIVTLRFDVSGLAAGTSPTIFVDDRPSAAFAAPLAVNPGRHQIVARLGSRQAMATVDGDGHEGQTLTVALAFDTRTSPVEAETGPSTSRSHPGGPAPSLAYFGLGVGAAGVAVTGVSGLLSVLARKASARSCATNCPPSSWAEADREQRMLGRISGVGIAMGAAGAGLAIGSLLMRQHSKSPASGGSTLGDVARSLTVKPAGAGVGLSVKF